VPVLKSALPLRITESMVWFSGWTLSSRAITEFAWRAVPRSTFGAASSSSRM